MDINKAIAEFDPKSLDQFRAIVSEALKISEGAPRDLATYLARECEIPQATVKRWASGLSNPHPVVRKVVVSVIKHYLATELKSATQ